MSYITIDSGADQELAQRLLATNFAGTVLEGTPETDFDFAAGVVVRADQKSFEAVDLPQADDTESNGSSTVRAYTLDAVTVFIESGENDGLHIYPKSSSIHDFLLGCDFGDLEACEFFAEWGFDGTPDEADESATDVRIWCEPNYYAGTLGAPGGHFVTEDDGFTARTFAAHSDAQEWIAEQEDGIYYTSHGEAGRPAYTICD